MALFRVDYGGPLCFPGQRLPLNLLLRRRSTQHTAVSLWRGAGQTARLTRSARFAARDRPKRIGMDCTLGVWDKPRPYIHTYIHVTFHCNRSRRNNVSNLAHTYIHVTFHCNRSKLNNVSIRVFLTTFDTF